MKSCAIYLLVLVAFLSLGPTFADNGMPPFHATDSSGNKFDYYPVGYLFLQEKEMAGRCAAGSFTIIKKVNKTGWLVEASEADMPTTRTYYLRIPKNWDIQTIGVDENGMYKSKLVKGTGAVPFRAAGCLSLIVSVTNKTMKFTNTLDDTEDTLRVLELKTICSQPCS